MRLKPPGGGITSCRPPVKTPFRKSLVTEPKSLAVVDQHFDGRASSISETKHHTAEGVLPKRLFAQPHEPIDPFAEIGRLHGDQNLHLRRDRQHHWASRKLRPTATKSVAS